MDQRELELWEVAKKRVSFHYLSAYRKLGDKAVHEEFKRLKNLR